MRRRGSALISGLLRGAETSLANAATSLDGLRAGDAPGGPASSEGAWASAIKEGARASESEATEGGARQFPDAARFHMSSSRDKI